LAKIKGTLSYANTTKLTTGIFLAARLSIFMQFKIKLR
jgi:hypothetical protein